MKKLVRTRKVLAVLLTCFIVWMNVFGVLTGRVYAEKSPNVIKSVSLSDKSTHLPGRITAYVELDAGEYKVEEVGIYFVRMDPDIYDPSFCMWGQWLANGEEIHDGRVSVDVPFDQSWDIGEYMIGSIDVELKKGEETLSLSYGIDFDYEGRGIEGRHYKKWYNFEQTGKVLKESDVTVGDKLMNGDEVVCESPSFEIIDDTEFYKKISVGDPDLVEKVKTVPEGKKVGIYYGYEEDDDTSMHINSDRVIPKEVFDYIAGKDIALIVYFESYRWIFYGKDIKGETKDICGFVNAYPVDNDSDGKMDDIDVIFPENGKLPCRTEVKLKSNYLWYGDSYKLNLYHVVGDEYILEENAECDMQIDSVDKWCCFYIDHNSTFLVTDRDMSKGKQEGDEDNKNGENSSKEKISDEWINGYWYDKDGNQTYQYKGSWKGNENGWWFEDESGWYPHDKWLKIDRNWYYFKPDGYMASNEYYNGCWFSDSGIWDSTYSLSWMSNALGWWVEDKSGWWPSSQWLKIDGSWYYFTSDGYMDYGEYRDGCWLGSDGAMDPNSVNGAWHLDGKGWYYSDNGWYPKNQYLWIDGTSYWFDSSGYCN